MTPTNKTKTMVINAPAITATNSVTKLLKYGEKNMTREKWEKTHKPTCNHYPCMAWRDNHWHVSDKFLDQFQRNKSTNTKGD